MTNMCDKFSFQMCSLRTASVRRFRISEYLHTKTKSLHHDFLQCIELSWIELTKMSDNREDNRNNVHFRA